MGKNHILTFPAQHCLVHHAEETWAGRDWSLLTTREHQKHHTGTRECETGLHTVRALCGLGFKSRTWMMWPPLSSFLSEDLPCLFLVIWFLNSLLSLYKNIRTTWVSTTRKLHFCVRKSRKEKATKSRKEKATKYLIHPKERKWKLICYRCY